MKSFSFIGFYKNIKKENIRSKKRDTLLFLLQCERQLKPKNSIATKKILRTFRLFLPIKE